MMSFRLAGVFCALWTPTDGDRNLLEAEFERNVAFVLERGVDGLMVLGSTGEFPHLEIPVRKRVLERTVALAGKIPVLANVSDIRPQVAADLARFARDRGASAISMLPPWFFEVSQRDLVEFFVRVGSAAGLPVVLYNYPERTGNSITLETIAAVADRLPLAGVKHSGSDFAWHGPLARLGKEKGFAVMTGADTRLPEALPLGATGCVSGLSNAVPDLVVKIFSSLQAARSEDCAEARAALGQVNELMGRLPFPLNVAAAMQARGLATGEFKIVLSDETRAAHAALVKEFDACYQQWRLI